MPVQPMLLHRMALVSFRLFCKNLGNLQAFFGQMVYRPPWQKIARTPMSTYFLIKTFTASQKLSAYLQHKTKFGKVVLIHLICPTLITDSIFLIQNHLCEVYYTNNNTSTPEVLLNSFQFINDFSFRLNSRIHLVYTLFDTAYFSFGKP